ncbi:MAG: hypothetical protein IJT36_06710 [Alphaproteobacteria bacterium]|nr:hypothetical protein [Alphaproteobacteria bacterium]
MNTKIQEKKKRESEITTSIAQIIEYQHLYGTPEKQEEITITIKSAEEDIRSVEIAIAKNDEELKALNDQLRQIDIELKHKQEILVVRAKSREIIPEIAQNSTDAILKRAAAYIQLGGLYRTYFSASFNDVEDISSQDAIDTISTQIVGRIPTGTAITGTLTAQFGAIWEQIRTNLNSDSENYTQWASNALLPIEKVLLFLSVSTNSSVASNSPAEITVQKLLIDSPKTPVHTQVQAEFFRHIAKHFWSIDIMKQKLPFKEEDLGNRDLPLQGASDVHTALEYESSAARSFSEENAKKVARGFMRIFAGTEGVSSWRSFTDDEGKPQIEIMRKVPFNERFHDINGTYKFKQGWYITRDSVDPEVVDNSSISEIYFRMRLDFSEGWNIFVTTYPVFQYESEQ